METRLKEWGDLKGRRVGVYRGALDRADVVCIHCGDVQRAYPSALLTQGSCVSPDCVERCLGWQYKRDIVIGEYTYPYAFYIDGKVFVVDDYLATTSRKTVARAHGFTHIMSMDMDVYAVLERMKRAVSE